MCVLVLQLCLTPIPWTVAHQVPLSMEFSRQEYWIAIPFSKIYRILNIKYVKLALKICLLNLFKLVQPYWKIISQILWFSNSSPTDKQKNICTQKACAKLLIEALFMLENEAIHVPIYNRINCDIFIWNIFTKLWK